MKKIFSCHTSFSWEGIKDSERHRWICSMMDIIRTFDILPHNILSSSLGPYTKWNACEQIYVKCNKIRERTDITQLASWAIKICNSICYPPHIDSINVKPIFRQLDFIGAVKDYLMMIAIYENSFVYKTNCFELLKNSKKESIDKMRRLFNEQRKEPSKKFIPLRIISAITSWARIVQKFRLITLSMIF